MDIETFIRDIETRKNFNKVKNYLTLFNNAYFNKDHMWILCEIPVKPKLYWIDNQTILGMDYLTWI